MMTSTSKTVLLMMMKQAEKHGTANRKAISAAEVRSIPPDKRAAIREGHAEALHLAFHRPSKPRSFRSRMAPSRRVRDRRLPARYGHGAGTAPAEAVDESVLRLVRGFVTRRSRPFRVWQVIVLVGSRSGARRALLYMLVKGEVVLLGKSFDDHASVERL